MHTLSASHSVKWGWCAHFSWADKDSCCDLAWSHYQGKGHEHCFVIPIGWRQATWMWCKMTDWFAYIGCPLNSGCNMAIFDTGSTPSSTPAMDTTLFFRLLYCTVSVLALAPGATSCSFIICPLSLLFYSKGCVNSPGVPASHKLQLKTACSSKPRLFCFYSGLAQFWNDNCATVIR